jgi:hypothetical protein
MPDVSSKARQAPLTNEPNEPRGPVLGERAFLFLADKHETTARRPVFVVLVPAVIFRHTNGLLLEDR